MDRVKLRYGRTQSATTPGPEAQAKILLARSSPAVAMLLDTGADTSTVPGAIITGLADFRGLPTTRFAVKTASGAVREMKGVAITIQIEDRFTFEVTAILTTKAYGLLGRDIANRMHINLAGPLEQWELSMNAP